MAKDSEKKKFSIFDWLKSVNGKIAIVIDLFVGYEELMPRLKGFFGFDDDLASVVTECNKYTYEKIEAEKADAYMWQDYFLVQIEKINDRYSQDSLEYELKHDKFAVGIRSDKSGIRSYRNSRGEDCSVRVNRLGEKPAIEYYDNRKMEWLPIWIEDQAE